MRVSLSIIARDEELYLPQLIENIKAQTYPHQFLEVIFIDSMSTDGTKKIMLDFMHGKHDFASIKVLENPRVIQAAGWNIAITNMSGDILIRLDAHTMIPRDFVQKNATLIESGENVCGGIRPCLIENETAWKKTLLQVENSLFGSSINFSRHGKKKEYVKTVFHAAYRKEVFKKAGMFDERLLRTEDNEMHYRIRKSGYKICFDPTIISYQYARSGLNKMLKQKFNNGYWVGVTLSVCPKCLSTYHFVPFAFILGIIFTSVLAVEGIAVFSAVMWTSYWALAIFMTVLCVYNNGRNRYLLLMPFLFFVLHMSYGIGTVKGILSIPLVKRKWNEKEIKHE